MMEKLLNEALETLAVGEIVHLQVRDVYQADQEQCGCGERFASYERWPEVEGLRLGCTRLVLRDQLSMER